MARVTKDERRLIDYLDRGIAEMKRLAAEEAGMQPIDTNANRVALVAESAIDLYVEYLTVHGYSLDRARHQAICDVIEGATAVIERREPGGVPDLETLPL